MTRLAFINGRVEWGGATVPLTQRQRAFLAVLVDRRRQVVSFNELRETAWGPDYALGKGGNAPRQAIRQMASKIMKAFRAADPEFNQLQAVRAIGYRWAEPLSLEEIVSAVSKRYGVAEADVRGDRRCRRFAWPRHVAYWLALRDKKRSTVMVGRFFDRDHTSVMHGRDRIERAISEGERLGQIAMELAGALSLPAPPVDGLLAVKHREAA